MEKELLYKHKLSQLNQIRLKLIFFFNLTKDGKIIVHMVGAASGERMFFGKLHSKRQTSEVLSGLY